MPHVHVVVNDLFFADRIEGALRQLGYDATIDDLSMGALTTLPAAADLLIADLEGGEAALAAVRQAKRTGTPVLAFGPHTDLALREAALEAGADQVVAKSKLTTAFAELVAALLGRA